ncbi:hypothetical protein NPS01_19280 [Nocardioides psychrotolerans]|uniref:Uncharacterized protein n=1 Tax=Nocardioides psychrotolerans TaxID=1005945 RepID=A0A1I3J5N2_9ACTN|nr:hypothetical protein [Nocardioides psychrotolerans]GEP38265.1 hypothetical protein NPS01_19280 [Nocardioides psychrotolerans]SFI55547.1 hypothetical protein SAMN05216561_11021 [Nocardioides psychrotolerans]
MDLGIADLSQVATALAGSARTRRHTVETQTPTGHTYRSRAPAPLGHVELDILASPVEKILIA